MANNGVKFIDATASIACALGTFYMTTGNDTSAAPFDTATWHMQKGVFRIDVIADAVIGGLEEGAAVSVLAEGTAAYPGQRVTGATLPAGTVIFAYQSFTKIVVTSGKIVCWKGGKST